MFIQSLHDFSFFFFFFNDTATTEIYTLSLHDALPIWRAAIGDASSSSTERGRRTPVRPLGRGRSEEHTSELQSPCNLVCRLLLEKKKKKRKKMIETSLTLHNTRYQYHMIPRRAIISSR